MRAWAASPSTEDDDDDLPKSSPAASPAQAASPSPAASPFLDDEETRGPLQNVLKQAVSRNKAIEKKRLWEEKSRQDYGSKNTLSLTSRDGQVRKSVTTISKGADVTANTVNKFDEDRLQNAANKEQAQLGRFCDGKDHAWRPDFFFSEACGEDDVPWPIRPSDLFANPTLCTKILATRIKQRLAEKEKKKAKKGKKEKKKAGKAEKGNKKSKKEKKRKKDNRGDKKDKEKKEKKSKKDERGEKRSEQKKAKKEKKARKEEEEEENEEEAGIAVGVPLSNPLEEDPLFLEEEATSSTSSDEAEEDRLRGGPVDGSEKEVDASPGQGSTAEDDAGAASTSSSESDGIDWGA